MSSEPAPGPFIGEFRFVLPFAVPSKKNGYAALAIPGPRGKPIARFHLKREHKKIAAAVRIWTVAELAYHRGLIREPTLALWRDLARQIALPRGGTGEAAIRAWEAELSDDMRRPLFGRACDARIEVEQLVADHEDGDRLAVTVRFAGTIRTKGRNGRSVDLDGVLTTICDAVEGALYENDRQVCEATIRRSFVGPARPGIVSP